jgi:hypothetical protein
MSENQPVWNTWALALQHWGINREIASILETAGSLSVLLAQLIYLTQPLLCGVIPSQSVNTCAKMLENPSIRHEFITVLKEGTAHGPAN